MRTVVFMVLAAAAGCGLGFGGSSRTGESCSSSGDCVDGRCIDLVCVANPRGPCTSSVACVSGTRGAICGPSGLCGCNVDADCASAYLGTARAPFCDRMRSSDGSPNDGGFSHCSTLSTPFGRYPSSSSQVGPTCEPSSATATLRRCHMGHLCSDRAKGECDSQQAEYTAYRLPAGPSCGQREDGSVTCEPGDLCVDALNNRCRRQN